jgi:hypothetical protein
MRNEPNRRIQFSLWTLLLLLTTVSLATVCVKQSLELDRMRNERRELMRSIILGEPHDLPIATREPQINPNPTD